MIHEISVNLGNVLLSFSDAIDLANDSIASHQMRTAFICWQMANAAELPLDEKQNLFIGAILHDVGALTAEDKMEVHNFDNVDPEPHCILGADLYESCSLLKESSQIVRWHHKPWSKWETSIDSKEVFGSQVLFLADHLERSIKQDQYILHQNEKITEKIISMSGSTSRCEFLTLPSGRNEAELSRSFGSVEKVRSNLGPVLITSLEEGLKQMYEEMISELKPI